MIFILSPCSIAALVPFSFSDYVRAQLACFSALVWAMSDLSDDAAMASVITGRACGPSARGVDGEKVHVGLNLNANTMAKMGRLALHWVTQ
jgi:hypothetical protein